MERKEINTGLHYADNLLCPFSVCHALIQDALHRCKVSEVATRITVTLTRLALTDEAEAVHRVSVADTGYGISKRIIEDFFPYKIRGGTSGFPSIDLHWDGVLLITTTCLNEQFVLQYEIKVGDQAVNHKVVHTSAQCKRSVFRGTESSITLKGNFTGLQLFIQDVCEKTTITHLKVRISAKHRYTFQDVFLEICEEEVTHCGKREVSRYLSFCEGGRQMEELSSSLNRLRIGLEEYTQKYIYKYTDRSTHQGLHMCTFKVGKNQTVVRARLKRSQYTVQVCFLLVERISQSEEDMLSSQPEHDLETQVYVFVNHHYCLQVPQMISRALCKVNWSGTGLRFKKVRERQSSATPSTFIEWDQYPKKIERLDLVLHKLADDSGETTWNDDLKVVKETIDAALLDLKAESPRLLSTPHEIQVQSSIPDLAKCISGIITSSGAKDFQDDCACILGLPPGKLSTMKTIIEAKLLAAFSKQTYRSEKDQESGAPESEPLLDEREETEEYDTHSQLWNYL